MLLTIPCRRQRITGERHEDLVEVAAVATVDPDLREVEVVQDRRASRASLLRRVFAEKKQAAASRKY